MRKGHKTLLELEEEKTGMVAARESPTRETVLEEYKSVEVTKGGALVQVSIGGNYVTMTRTQVAELMGRLAEVL